MSCWWGLLWPVLNSKTIRRKQENSTKQSPILVEKMYTQIQEKIRCEVAKVVRMIGSMSSVKEEDEDDDAPTP